MTNKTNTNKQTLNKNSLFYDYDLIKEEVQNNYLTIFNNLNETQKEFILRCWFGRVKFENTLKENLLQEFFNNERAIKSLIQGLINLKYKGEYYTF